jgi:hypothetical protein
MAKIDEFVVFFDAVDFSRQEGQVSSDDFLITSENVDKQDKIAVEDCDSTLNREETQ